jgi:hypothetical protein
MHQDQQNRINRLEAEASELRKQLAALTSQLLAAEEIFSRNRGDGQGVTALANEKRLAELRLQGVEKELAQARAPRRIARNYSRLEDVVRARRDVEQKRKRLHEVREQQTQTARAEMDGHPEEHVRIHVRNRMSNSEVSFRKEDEQLARQLRALDDEISLYDQHQTGGPEAA